MTNSLDKAREALDRQAGKTHTNPFIWIHALAESIRHILAHLDAREARGADAEQWERDDLATADPSPPAGVKEVRTLHWEDDPPPPAEEEGADDLTWLAETVASDIPTRPIQVATDKQKNALREWASQVADDGTGYFRALAGLALDELGQSDRTLRSSEAARERAERERDELDAVWHNAESKIAELELRAGKAEAELSRLRKAAKEARDDAARACEVGGGNPILALAGIKSRLTSALEPEGGDPDKPETRVSGQDKSQPVQTIEPAPALLPCPFCGSTRIQLCALAARRQFGRNDARVECRDCDAAMHGTDDDTASAAWNRREPAPAPSVVEGLAKALEAVRRKTINGSHFENALNAIIDPALAAYRQKGGGDG